MVCLRYGGGFIANPRKYAFEEGEDGVDGGRYRANLWRYPRSVGIQAEKATLQRRDPCPKSVASPQRSANRRPFPPI